jgi:hypothetical protein
LNLNDKSTAELAFMLGQAHGTISLLVDAVRSTFLLRKDGRLYCARCGRPGHEINPELDAGTCEVAKAMVSVQDNANLLATVDAKAGSTCQRCWHVRAAHGLDGACQGCVCKAFVPSTRTGP